MVAPGAADRLGRISGHQSDGREYANGSCGDATRYRQVPISTLPSRAFSFAAAVAHHISMEKHFDSWNSHKKKVHGAVDRPLCHTHEILVVPSRRWQ